MNNFTNDDLVQKCVQYIINRNTNNHKMHRKSQNFTIHIKQNMVCVKTIKITLPHVNSYATLPQIPILQMNFRYVLEVYLKFKMTYVLERQ